jgi:plasmid stability protein
MAKQDDFIKTALRLPRDLHAKLQDAAAKSGRSLNAEFIAALEAGTRDGPKFDVELHARLTKEAWFHGRSVEEETYARIRASFDLQKLDLSIGDVMDAIHALSLKNDWMDYQLIVGRRDMGQRPDILKIPEELRVADSKVLQGRKAAEDAELADNTAAVGIKQKRTKVK